MSADTYTVVDEYTVDGEPPERLERRVRQCSAVTEDGTRCKTLTLHSKCWRHRQHDGNSLPRV